MSPAAIHVVGSINIDHVYRVARLAEAGETLHALGYATSLGGKGANQAIAAARAGASVHMIGAVGVDGAWARERLAAEGIGIDGIDVLEGTTGHARIEVDDRGENRIVLLAGANQCLVSASIRRALSRARPGDWLVLQNETTQVTETAALGRTLGMTVAYSAAPFVAEAVASVLPHVDLLAVNEIEAAQLRAHLGSA
ncbi:MAG: ribokinase, partial [Gammaproteobacteria bacterium]|nr:ribokinase [Gammaproteobacteria bacterium]